MDSGNQHLSFGHEGNKRMQKELKIAVNNILIKMQQTGNLHSFFGREEIGRMQKELEIVIKMQQMVPYKPAEGNNGSQYPVLYHNPLIRKNCSICEKYARPSLRPALKEVDIENFCNRMGAPYCTAKFNHPYHEKEMKNEINYAIAGQLLPNFIPDDVTTPDSFRNIPSDCVFNAKEEKNKENYSFQSLLHPGFIQGGFPYPHGSLNPLAVNSRFQGTQNQQNNARASSLHSERFHREEYQKKGITPTKIQLKFQQDLARWLREYGVRIIRGLTKCHPQCFSCLNRYKDYVVLAAETGSNLIPGIAIPLKEEECDVCTNLKSVNRSMRCQEYEVDSHRNTRYLFFIQGSPGGITGPDETNTRYLFSIQGSPDGIPKPDKTDFQWNKENRQWNSQPYSEGIPQHEERSIPQGPPACVVCLSNPSKNNLFCADCLNSIER